ncbi:MAG TPA: alpha/beta hydrolase, partial [Cryomorphaceae bacterium]|nr:alpha/beta hydrolase [Cryomorphaceae bacterium]
MKNSLQISFLLVFLIGTLSVQGQTRYLDQIFDSQIIIEGEQIGFNVDALRSDFSDVAGFQMDMTTLNELMANDQDIPLNYFQSNGNLPEDQQTTAKLFPIEMDIYTPPAEDEDSNRPLIVYIHTGNFLPPVINGGPGGSRKDSVVVNLCKQWAQKGYVVAALSYRLGWNPISENPDVRRGTLLQAVYRAIHDTQTAVRYMRATVSQGNPYGINPEQVALFGQGSGGYVAQAYATLDDYNNEIAIPKFIGGDGVPYVVEAIDGTIEG